MARRRFVEPRPALQQKLGGFFRDPGPVIAYRQYHAAAGRIRYGLPDGDRYAAVAPLAGVVEQVAREFQEIALVAAKTDPLVDLHFDQGRLVVIHLGHAVNEALHFPAYRHGRQHELAGAVRRRLAQLVAHDLVHAVDLLIEPIGDRAKLLLLQQRPHCGQRRLQAVRQVVQRGLVAIRTRAFAVDQEVHVAGDAAEFRREHARQRLSPALFDLADLRLDLP